MLEPTHSPLQTALPELRKSLSFKSARAFYHDYLNQRTRLDINYSYYMKIEGGKLIDATIGGYARIVCDGTIDV